MYSLINQHRDTLLNKLAASNHIDDYCWLRTRLAQVNVADDAEFKRRYKAFWAMNVARLSDGFTNAYFAYLEQHKHDDLAPTADNAAKALYEFQTGANGRRSLQFSFASKLAHMIEPARPVYDRMVERFYFLPNGTATGLDRLQPLMASYAFLVGEYQRILGTQDLTTSINACRERFPNAQLTEQKIIDSLIWSFVSWLQGGAIRDGHIVYT